MTEIQELASRLLARVAQGGPVPEHIAFIMDGNRRYSEKYGISKFRGHYLGGKALEKALDFCYASGVKVVTVYAFSIENFKRSKEEVNKILTLVRHQLPPHCGPSAVLTRYGVALRPMGHLDLLDDATRETVIEVASRTGHYTQRFFNLCISYTSRDEMARAVRKKVEQSSCSMPVSITPQLLTDNMDTPNDFPVDTLVRTSGAARLSDFLLWQCHDETDIQFVDTLWPNFGVWNIFLVIARWQRRRPAAETSCTDNSQWRSSHGLPGVRLVSVLSSMILALSVSIGWYLLSSIEH